MRRKPCDIRQIVDLANRYNIPIRFENGWSYIAANAYRTLWPTAAAKIAEASAPLSQR
jgi:hypothetical protein